MAARQVAQTCYGCMLLVDLQDAGLVVPTNDSHWTQVHADTHYYYLHQRDHLHPELLAAVGRFKWRQARIRRQQNQIAGWQALMDVLLQKTHL